MEDLGNRPVVFVIAGPNGAGKTTAATLLLPEKLDLRHFVNADAIAVGLSAFAPETVALQAGRIMLARIDDLSQQRQDFALETTLSATSLARRLQRLQTEGYLVQIVYVWLRSSDIAVRRVA
jgi:predicted ABC-type ATPase